MIQENSLPDIELLRYRDCQDMVNFVISPDVLSERDLVELVTGISAFPFP